MAGETQMSAQLVVSRGVEKRFRGRTILSGLSLHVAPKEIVSLLGPSGIGKTTLLNMIVGCEKPDAGHIDCAQTRIGYVFQEDRLMPWLTLWENIRLVAPDVPPQAIDQALEAVSLSDFRNFYPKELSGGMRQRGSIARALCFGADLLLLDEPFKSLDVKLRYEMLDLLVKLKEEQGVSSLMVTHDIDEAFYVSDRLLIMSGVPACICASHTLGAQESEAQLESMKQAVWDILHTEANEAISQEAEAEEAARNVPKPIRRGGTGCGCSNGLLSGPKPKGKQDPNAPTEPAGTVSKQHKAPLRHDHKPEHKPDHDCSICGG